MKIICLVGPTGSGKTYTSVALAKLLKAEIINADSVQIYKEFNIGSAKATKEEQNGVKHHLLDVLDVHTNYTVFDYQKDARNILDKLIKRDKNVIITGGTGLYIKALLYNYKFEIENKVSDKYKGLTNEELKEKIDKIYPDNKIHANNRRRLERFLESYESTGRIIKNEDKDEKMYDFITIGLTMDRKLLYSRLDSRVDYMIENGLLHEAKSLYNKKAVVFNSIIGYKEFVPYFKGEASLGDTINLIKQHTRNYAKRQYTWFNNQMETTWFNMNVDNPSETVNEIYNFIKNI